MAAERGQPQCHRTVGRWVLRDAFEGQEVRASGTGVPDPATGRNREVEAPGLTYPSIEVAEQRGKHIFDPVADQIVVLFESRPVNTIVPQRCLGDAANDRD